MINDPFKNTSDSPMAPAESCFSVTPDDTTELSICPKAIYIGTGGDITLIPLRGTVETTFRNLPDGSILDVRPRVVLQSGTTAADIIGLV